jgi:hypothetical protein
MTMARKPVSPPLRGPIAFGGTTLPDGWFPRNVAVVADPFYRMYLQRMKANQPRQGIVAALADTGVNAGGVQMTFAKVIKP